MVVLGFADHVRPYHHVRRGGHEHKHIDNLSDFYGVHFGTESGDRDNKADRDLLVEAFMKGTYKAAAKSYEIAAKDKVIAAKDDELAAMAKMIKDLQKL